MLSKLRYLINNKRQDFLSLKRKKQLAREIDSSKIKHLQPSVQCEKSWYGNSYGGFYINPTLLSENAIIYSFGIGKDISFDTMCIKKHNCKVYGFDPTPKSIDFVKNHVKNKHFMFFDYGIGTTSKTEIFYLPKNPKGTSGSIVTSKEVNTQNNIKVTLKSFTEITKTLNHNHIDVLKIDIEGAEYLVLESIINSKITIDQILVEFHDRLFNEEVFKSVKIVEKLKSKGYKIFASSISYEEISFIHESKLK